MFISQKEEAPNSRQTRHRHGLPDRATTFTFDLEAISSGVRQRGITCTVNRINDSPNISVRKVIFSDSSKLPVIEKIPKAMVICPNPNLTTVFNVWPPGRPSYACELTESRGGTASLSKKHRTHSP